MPSPDPIELLVVDDDPILRIDLADRLRRRGFKVFRAANATKPEDHGALSNDPAVLSDLEMPGSMDGLELLHEIFRRWPDRGSILISGWSAPGPRQCRRTRSTFSNR